MDNLIPGPLSSEPVSNFGSFVDFAKQSMNETGSCSYKDTDNDQYCLEMFRRALLQKDQAVQKCLQQCFREVVLDWVRHYPWVNADCYPKDEEYHVNQAFERFWKTENRHFEVKLATLSEILLYLHVCLNSSILDTVRNSSRAKVIADPKSGLAEESCIEDYGGSHELWQIIQRMLSNEREQRIVYLLFHCGFKPEEIAGSWPQEFGDISEIARLRRNIVGLLGASDQILKDQSILRRANSAVENESQ